MRREGSRDSEAGRHRILIASHPAQLVIGRHSEGSGRDGEECAFNLHFAFCNFQFARMDFREPAGRSGGGGGENAN